MLIHEYVNSTIAKIEKSRCFSYNFSQIMLRLMRMLLDGLVKI